MNPMRLGVSLNCITPKITAEALDTVRRSSIETFEIPVSYFKSDGDAKRALVRRILPDRVGSVHALFGAPYDFSSLDRAVHRAAMDEARHAVDLAADLGAEIVVLHLSAEPVAPVERPARLDQARTAVRIIAEHARKLTVKLAIELLPRTCLGNASGELLEVLDDCDPRTVGACLDVNHVMHRYLELPDDIRTLGDRLIHLHLSDYDGVDEKHWMPGDGVIDWKELVHALRETGYAGPLHYESASKAETVSEKVRDFEQNYARLMALLAD